MFVSDKPFDDINSAMPTDSDKWFGKRPPDLSLIARAKGVDYIYSASSRAFMSTRAALGRQQRRSAQCLDAVRAAVAAGPAKAGFKNETVDGEAKVVLTGVEPLSPGSMTPEEYDQFVRDIANFLDYAAEPIKAKRQFVGIFVTLFLLVFLGLAYLLKKEYWKDVH
jgi:ubiquinol-cytochrome c reductase cytochrome c1 subunit